MLIAALELERKMNEKNLFQSPFCVVTAAAASVVHCEQAIEEVASYSRRRKLVNIFKDKTDRQLDRPN